MSQLCLCSHRTDIRCDADHCDIAGPGAPGDANQCRVCWLRLNGVPRAGQTTAIKPRLAKAPELLPGVVDPIRDPELRPMPQDWASRPDVKTRHIEAFADMLNRQFPPPEKAEGTGILFCGGGRYWPMVCVAVRMTRLVSNLPIQIWHRGTEEPVDLGDLDGVENVQVIDASKYPTRILRGWEVKALGLIHCGWEKVLYLDADAYPVADVQPLIDLATEETPFVFWQDLPGNDRTVQWDKVGLEGSRGVPSVQGGQLVIHRRGFWRELVLTYWLNSHSDYYYSVLFGDQDCLRLVLAATTATPV